MDFLNHLKCLHRIQFNDSIPTLESWFLKLEKHFLSKICMIVVTFKYTVFLQRHVTLGNACTPRPSILKICALFDKKIIWSRFQLFHKYKICCRSHKTGLVKFTFLMVILFHRSTSRGTL